MTPSPRVAAAACVALGTVLVLVTIARTSVTLDEPYFYAWGRRVVFEGRFDRPALIDDSKLPVSALPVLPEWLARRVGLAPTIDPARLHGAWTPDEAAYIAEHFPIYMGRLVGVGVYVALCWLVFHMGSVLYGPVGGAAATALTAFLPMVLGHAGLVTVDVAAAATFLAAVYTLARLCLVPSLRTSALAGLALGLAMLVKYSIFDLGPVAVGLVALRLVMTAPGERRGRVAARIAGGLVTASIVALLVVNLGFGFQGSGGRLVDLPCRSSPFRWLRALAGGLPLPLPYEYANGLDAVLFRDEQGVGGGSVYLLGAQNRQGFASYYAIATLVKTPLVFLLLCAVRPWRRSRRFWDVALALPVAVLFTHLSFFFRTQVGLRYLLPAFPLLALLAAANWDAARPPWWRRTATGLLAVYVAAAVWHVPRYLAYFNVLIGPQANAYRVLADSNLDWGQDYFTLWAWERAQPEGSYVVQPYYPTRGRVVVSVNDYLGITEPDAYRWLRDHHAPVATIGDAWLLFEVDG